MKLQCRHKRNGANVSHVVHLAVVPAVKERFPDVNPRELFDIPCSSRRLRTTKLDGNIPSSGTICCFRHSGQLKRQTRISHLLFQFLR